VSETDKESTVTAKLPGLDEKDVHVEVANGVLAIAGEKRTETEDKDRRFGERSYGRFERRMQWRRWTRTRYPPPLRTEC
jgi:HSP20 family protein